MKTKIENIHEPSNRVNGFYFRCKNCGMIIFPIGAYLKEGIGDIACYCDNPEIENTFFIHKRK